LPGGLFRKICLLRASSHKPGGRTVLAGHSRLSQCVPGTPSGNGSRRLPNRPGREGEFAHRPGPQLDAGTRTGGRHVSGAHDWHRPWRSLTRPSRRPKCGEPSTTRGWRNGCGAPSRRPSRLSRTACSLLWPVRFLPSIGGAPAEHGGLASGPRVITRTRPLSRRPAPPSPKPWPALRQCAVLARLRRWRQGL